MDGHPVKLSGAAQSRLLVRRRTSSFVAKRATVPRLEAPALPRPSTPYGHTQRAWTSPRGGADRERADLVGLDELMEALAADPQQFATSLMVRSRSHPSGPAASPSGLGRDGISGDERGQVGFLDEEFFGNTLRRKLLCADQPPHGTGPDAEPCSHLASGEVLPLSLGLHGVYSPPFYCSGSRSGFMRTCPRLRATCPSDSSNPGDALGIVDTKERPGARGSGPRFLTATPASQVGRLPARPQVHHGWRLAPPLYRPGNPRRLPVKSPGRRVTKSH